MARTYGPLFSMDASGTIGNAITFSKWKGRNYVRNRVIPHNPKSAGQTAIRAMFGFLAQAWAAILTADKATWDDEAGYDAISDFNAYQRKNQKRYRDFKAPSQANPAAEVGTPSVTPTPSAAAGERSITVTQTVTTANDGWAIAFFRSPTGAFNASWDNLVAVKPISGTDDVLFIDSPLEVGTYYYSTRSITVDGVWGTETAECTAEIT